MHLDGNIAKNAALRENVFMMAVCIELKIPLFLVGKPGSSKSLAKAIINESMRGKDSRTELLKKFKEVSDLVITTHKDCNWLSIFVCRSQSFPISAVSFPLLRV